MDLLRYLRVFRRWLWVLLIAAVIGGGASYFIRSQRPVSYSAFAKISIGSVVTMANLTYSETQAIINLTATYAALAKTYDVMQAAIDESNLPISVELLQVITEVEIVPGTSFVDITVTHSDPALVATAANAIAEQLIVRNPTNLTPQQEEQLQQARNQVERLNNQIVIYETQINQLNEQIENTTDDERRANLTYERSLLVGQNNLASQTIANFTATIAGLQRRTNSLNIVERARVPAIPESNNLAVAAAVGAMVTTGLAIGVILLIEYLDDTIKTSKQAEERLHLPVLAAILKFGNSRDPYPQRLITQQPAYSPVVESYRKLRTGLLFAGEENRKSIYVITSPGASEGKSVTSANLAVSMATAGLRVLLIDADLRRPRVHEIFNLSNEYGLSSLLMTQSMHVATVSANGKDENSSSTANVNLSEVLQSTDVPRLRVITSGPIPANPAEILGSALMQHWLNEFLSSSNVDVIIIDTPPCLAVADTSILAAAVQADVLLVIQAERTRLAAILKAQQEFHYVGRPIRGIIVNGANPLLEYHRYGYGYGYYQQEKSQTEKA